MKITLPFFFMLIFSSTSNGQVDSLGCAGVVGDIKYSILAPDDFQDVNGNCWVLSDGRNISSSKLGAFGYDIAPDYRGVFIRSYDNRQSNREDIDRTFGEELGTYQEDAFEMHNHVITPLRSAAAGGGGARRIVPPWDTGDNGANTGTGSLTTTSNGASPETRPKNRTAYTYIRIN